MKNKVEITTNDRVHLLAKYLGATLYDEDYPEDYSQKLISVELDREMFGAWVQGGSKLTGSNINMHTQDVVLKLKSRDRISKEQVKECIEFVNKRTFDFITIMSATGIHVVPMFEDYWRRRGYDCDNMIRLGLAVEVEHSEL